MTSLIEQREESDSTQILPDSCCSFIWMMAVKLHFIFHVSCLCLLPVAKNLLV